MRVDLLVQLLLTEPLSVLRAVASWPRFSLSSYAMLRPLSRQGTLPGTVLDIGANDGQFAIAAAKLFPDARVYAYEPVPAVFDRLSRHTRNTKNIRCFNLGLGDRESELPITVNSHSHSSSFLRLSEAHKEAFPFAKEGKPVLVSVTSLDVAVGSLDLVPPVLLKLDVQGFEANVLEGAESTLKRVDFVIVEASLRPMYEGETLFTEMIKLLDSRGFEFLRPVGWLSSPTTGEILQLDCLFGRRDRGG